MSARLPHGWTRALLGEICDTQLGKTLSTKPRPGERLRPYLRNKNVQWYEFDLTHINETNLTEEEEAKYKLRPGDLLVCEGGEVGRCAIWQQPTGEMHFQNALHRVRPVGGVDVKWIQYFLRWAAETGQLKGHTSGVTIDHLVQRELRQLAVPVAPIVEQERIVSAIEQHFSRLDAAEAALQAARARCHALTKSVIISAIPGETPADWRHTLVVDAGTTGLGRQRSPKYHNGTNMKPYLRVANVFEDRIDAADIMQMHFDEADFEKYRLENGDVLLNEGQSPELLGRPAIYRGEPPEVAFTNSLIRFVPKPGVTSEWALLVFRRHMHAGRFKEESRITTNIAHLALGRFRTVEFPIPPLEVQEQVVASTRETLDAVDRQVDQIDRAIATIRSLRRSVLATAFSGRLVPQDPDDEPASVLLERIAASRPSKPTRRKVRA